MVEKIPVILLIGAGHSGSTLLDLVFGSHSKIFGVGELSYYSYLHGKDSPCACGTFLETCPFWQRVFRGVDFKKMPLIYQPKREFLFSGAYYVKDTQVADTTAYLENLERTYRNILKVSNRKIIFDSSKSPDRAKLIVESNRFDVTIFHLVRDGRGVLFSNVRRGRSPFEMIRHWVNVNIKSEIVKRRNTSGTNITVRYIDFATNPEEVLRHLTAAVGVRFEDNMLNFRNTENHQVGGNGPVKQHTTNEIRPDLGWQKQLSMRDRLSFELCAGWLNMFYNRQKKSWK